ncbi:LANO_0A00804g1_1 [Lachancea nothofagi CBS 11611]|uniref:LANO_0A00804g1_1 n=1 Tax=Lachancea nothofagi CBS 11611 TaxID=1266666 RepID=A0A1G4ILV8_9SACH|nr:LANO_0A00804g1_1 [Lachancea nothofagi CBS 11611]
MSMYGFRRYFAGGTPLERLKWPTKKFCMNNRFFGSGRAPRPSQYGLRPARMGKVLWRYFNAPGNVMFVTTNVVTLVGIMSYTTLQGMARERAMQEYLQDKAWEFSSEESSNVVSGKAAPFRKYKASDILLQKNGSPATCHMQHAKMSLFHLLYSFYLCRDATAPDQGLSENDSTEWIAEAQQLRQGLPKGSQQVSPQTFYSIWRQEFDQLFSSLSRSQQFHMPNWTQYPHSLQAICQKLHDNELRTLSDFMQFYQSVKPGSIRALLRAWLYDNFRLFQVTTDVDNEGFYRHLVQTCGNDRYLFTRYASILLNPDNPRRRAFFNRHSHEEMSVSLDTVLEVLKGNLQAATGALNKSNCHESILRLVALIRTSCVTSRGSMGKPEVRVLLPDNNSQSWDSQNEHRTSSKDRNACYKLVSQNPELMAVLGAISNLPS